MKPKKTLTLWNCALIAFDGDALRGRHVRHVERDRREQHDPLVQALVVLEAVQQRVRHGVEVRRS